MKFPASMILAAGLLACAEPRPSGTGGNNGAGTSTSAGSSTGATGGNGSTGGATTAGTTGGGSGSGGTTGGAGGMCSRPGDCASRACLGNHCCASACKLDDPTGACVPTSCQTDGTCAYPGSTIACGGGCDSANHFTRAGSCDNAGSCSSATQDCGKFACRSTGCPSACSDDTACVAGAHCFLPQRVCCPAIAPGATLYVDGSIGSDTGCCGSAPGSPCQTLTAAMDEIERSGASGVTINAAVNGGTGEWTAPETWPVTLHLGVTLHAPGVYFFVPDVPSTYVDLFDVKPFDASDRQPVIIEGDAVPNAPALVGFDSSAGQYANTRDGIFVSGLTLKIGGVWLNGSNAGVEVGDNGTLEIDGLVLIGYFPNPSKTSTVVGYDGISCAGSGMAATAEVIDPGAMDGDLVIQGESHADINANSFCTVNLLHKAFFGVDPVNGMCPNPKPDVDGVLVDGDPVQVTLNSPVIQCMSSQGVQLYGGNPVVTLNGALIDHCGCAGLSTYAGNLYSNAGVILLNHWGVLQETGQIFLNGSGTGGVGGANVVGCSTEAEPGDCFGHGYPGVDIENDSTSPMNADGCAVDHAPPSEMQCTDPQYDGCVCISTTACSPPTDFDGVDIALVTGAGATSAKNLVTNGLGCR
jgi:hypothetical protein